MRRYLGIMAAIVLTVAVVLPEFGGQSQAQTGPSASIRLVQTVPDAPPIDVYINGKKASSDLAYQAIADYTDLPGGSYDIKLFPSTAQGQGTALVDLNNYNLSNGSKNTVVVAGLYNQKPLSALPLDDNVWVADATQARVRFIHASPDAPAVDIWIDRLGKVFNNISFKSVGQYQDVAAGSYKLTGRPTGQDKTVLSKDLTFEAGKVYTVYAVGQLKDQSLTTLVSVDNALPLQMPATGQSAVPTTNNFNLPLLVGLSLLIGLSLATLRFAPRKR